MKNKLTIDQASFLTGVAAAYIIDVADGPICRFGTVLKLSWLSEIIAEDVRNYNAYDIKVFMRDLNNVNGYKERNIARGYYLLFLIEEFR